MEGGNDDERQQRRRQYKVYNEPGHADCPVPRKTLYRIEHPQPLPHDHQFLAAEVNSNV